MSEQQAPGLFSSQAEIQSDPFAYLMDRALEKAYSPEEQISQITETILQCFQAGGLGSDKLFFFLDALKQLFGDDKLAFRAHLRDLYTTQFLKDSRVGTTVSTKFRIAILGEILRGWSQEKRYSGERREYGYSEYYELSKDAEECLMFLCAAFRESKILRDDILTLFREHEKESGFTPETLSPWILRDDVPNEIRESFLHGRIKFRKWSNDVDGLSTTIQELALLEPFALLRRSKEARQLVQKYMEAVRRTEELAQEFVTRIQPWDSRGDGNPNSPIRSGEVSYKLISSELVEVTVRFGSVADLDTDNEIESIRDKMLEGVENPPHIYIIRLRAAAGIGSIDPDHEED